MVAVVLRAFLAASSSKAAFSRTVRFKVIVFFKHSTYAAFFLNAVPQIPQSVRLPVPRLQSVQAVGKLADAAAAFEPHELPNDPHKFALCVGADLGWRVSRKSRGLRARAATTGPAT